MLKTIKKKRPKDKVKNKKKILATNLCKKERDKEILNYKQGRY